MNRFSPLLLAVSLILITSTALAQSVVVAPGAPVTTETATQIQTRGSGPQLFAQQIGQQQLHDLVRRSLVKTQTIIMMAHDYGKPMISTALDREIERAAQPYQAQWNTNLAASYDGLLTTSEWASIIAKKPTPDVKAKFPQVMMTAGQKMQVASQSIVETIGAEVLQKLSVKYPLKSATATTTP